MGIGGGTGGARGARAPQKSKTNNRAPPKFDIKVFNNKRRYTSLVHVEQLEMAQQSLKKYFTSLSTLSTVAQMGPER